MHFGAIIWLWKCLSRYSFWSILVLYLNILTQHFVLSKLVNYLRGKTQPNEYIINRNNCCNFVLCHWRISAAGRPITVVWYRTSATKATTYWGWSMSISPCQDHPMSTIIMSVQHKSLGCFWSLTQLVLFLFISSRLLLKARFPGLHFCKLIDKITCVHFLSPRCLNC